MTDERARSRAEVELSALPARPPVSASRGAVRFFALLLPLLLPLALCRPAPPTAEPRAVPARPTEDRASEVLLEDLEQRTFRWFWELADRETGLVPDRAPTPSFSSIAAVGFGLTA